MPFFVNNIREGNGRENLCVQWVNIALHWTVSFVRVLIYSFGSEANRQLFSSFLISEPFQVFRFIPVRSYCYFYFHFSQSSKYITALKPKETVLSCLVCYSWLVAHFSGICCVGIMHKLFGIKISRLLIFSYVHEKLFASLHYVPIKTLS